MKIKINEEKTMQVLAHVVMIVLSILAVIPFLLLISASFTEETVAVKYGYKFLPSVFSLDAYQYIFKQWEQIGRAYGITILVTAIGTVIMVMITSMFAYGLIQKNIRGIKVIFILVIVTMLFNGGIVPTYYIYNNIFRLKDTIWGLIIPNLLMNAFTLILVKSYMQFNIPPELMEAAEIDGAGQFTIFFKMVFPLSAPIIATIGLLGGVAYWNDWINGLYYIQDANLFSIQQLLNAINNNIQFLANNATNMSGNSAMNLPSATIRMAIAVVAILPIVMIYPFFHKYFAKGLTMGAVKG